MFVQSQVHVRTGRDGVISRRGLLRTLGAGAALGMITWREALALHADELRRQGRACILLFMQGGPSHLETFDPKPGTPTGGPTRAMATAVPGIQIAEGWTRLAQEMRDVALIRSMTNREGEHARAIYQLHTGYAPGGALRHPTLGSIVSSQIAPQEFDLPHFVTIGGRGPNLGLGAGYLGNAFSPFVVNNPNQLPSNLQTPNGINRERFGRRLDLMRDLEEDFANSGTRARVQQHQTLYDSAARMVRSPNLQAFDLAQERDAVRDRYGRTTFGQGCLLARRLVEAGVTCVEVEMGNWDTHQDNFTRTRALVDQTDPGFAALLSDLRERRLLERTLVIWMGEFGRTPRINANTGRDHWPGAFSIALAGAGIRGGRVIGATDESGARVTQRPVTVPDLFCTFCQALGVNPRREIRTSIGRPMRIVDGGQSVRELF
jgi:uncharacterized protein (DUF1501 family)